jgi:hypothetical protein
MKKTILLAFSVIPFLSGCYYPQPSNIGQDSGINSTTLLVGAAGAAGGGYVGSKMNSEYGAPVGAAVGGLAAGGVTAMVQSRKQRELAEAYEEGLRKGRAQVYDDWWDDVAIFNDPLDQLNKKGPKTRQIPLPAGEYESVPYHNRTYEFLVSPK